MIEKFDYPSDIHVPIRWKIEYEISDDECFRNYVLLEQIKPWIENKKTIPFIMLNPGSFKSKETLGRDKTLEYVRNAFLNTGYKIEILNLFNRCESKKKNLIKMTESERNRNNIIEERLNFYKKEDKVIIHWGKLNDKISIKRAEIILEIIKENDLIKIGFMDKTESYYPHPMRWNFVNGHKRFKDEVISKI